MLLADLVACSDEVASTRARSAKIASLAGLLARVEVHEIVPAVAMLTGEARSPGSGALAPRERRRIGVGWATVGGLDAPAATAPSLTIADLDSTLDRLGTISGAGSAATRSALLHELLARATAAEQSFIRRLLIGELRQGALAGIMADAIAKAAGVPLAAVRRAAMLAGDLTHIAAVAPEEGAEGLAAIGLVVSRPVLPMLASTSPDVATALDDVGGLASVEWKLDGARIQVHRDGDDISIYTRNLNDVTARLPGIVEGVRGLTARSFVLDGEAIGFDDSERPGVFQETMSSFGRQDGIAGAGLAARFFDILHVDGADLLDEPLTARLDALEQLVGPWRVPGIVTDDPDEAARFADDALARGHEGVMVKAAASRYEAGRRGKSWRKVKPVHTLDLVVLGVEWGSGRRRGWLSNLHLGARDPADPEHFVMVGKTFKGLTDALLQWQTDELLARKVSDEGHVVWVRPELVVEIALDGVQRSTRYPGGVALRFARVKRYRDDKSPADADTIDAVRAMLLGT
jgi:DNA ligase-1